MEKRKSKTKKWCFLVLGILLILIIFFFYIWVSSPLKVETLDVSFIVGPSIGFDLNSSLLTFGMITPGGSGARKVFIENNYDFDVVVDIFVSENILEFIFSSSQVVILSGEKKRLFLILLFQRIASLEIIPGKLDLSLRKLGVRALVKPF